MRIRFSAALAFLALPLPAAAVMAEGPASLPTGDATEVRARLGDWQVAASQPTGQPLLAPVGAVRLSSSFGARSDPFTGTVRRHAGIDLPGLYGTPVHAAADGIVAFAGRAGSYGNLVEVAHGDGLTTRYAHMERIVVAPGVPVHRGEVIGLMGSTGRSTGSHLHFEVRVDGRPADPLARLNRTGTSGAGPVVEHWAGYGEADPERLPAAQIR